MFTLYGLLSEGFPQFPTKLVELTERIRVIGWLPFISIMLDFLLIEALIILMMWRGSRKKKKATSGRKPLIAVIIAAAMLITVYAVNVAATLFIGRFSGIGVPFPFIGIFNYINENGIDWTPAIPIIMDLLLIIALIYALTQKEVRRKFKVALKRKPQNVPLVFTVLAFMVYSFNLSNITRTINDIQGGLIAQAGFATMLLSILVIVCCLNAFPYRKKPNIPMMAAMFVMITILLACDVYFRSWIIDATTRAKDTRAWNGAMRSAAFSVMLHAVITFLAGVLAALVPVLRKWFRHFDTSVALEAGEEMSAIDISGE